MGQHSCRNDLGFSRFKSCLLILAAAVGIASLSIGPVRAGDLPLAAGSPLAGFNFDDRPLLLPVQRNFQMAMLTAGSELQRSCGRMEAYGWRMNQAEQGRVDLIFNNTVDRLRALGYSIQAEAPTSVSHDITMFTADRPDKHFLVMWSAGELGLVMTLCETTPPAGSRPPVAAWNSTQVFNQNVVQSRLETPRPTETLRRVTNFTPVGAWVGDYTCSQGYTGATLHISHLKKGNFDGIFHFYPTAKNPSIAEGSYSVYGQYDPESQRILINPGKWLKRPHNLYNTVMVGGFDPARNTFSAYFQGVNGCTSFEARQQSGSKLDPALKRAVSKKKKHKAKKAVHKKVTKAAMQDEVTIISPGSDAKALESAPKTETAAPTTILDPLPPVPAAPAAKPVVHGVVDQVPTPLVGVPEIPKPDVPKTPVPTVPAIIPAAVPAPAVPVPVVPTVPATTVPATTAPAKPVVPAQAVPAGQ